MAETRSTWVIEPFDRLRHDRTGFDCGLPVLHEWLGPKVSQFQKKNLARTCVLVETGKVIVAEQSGSVDGLLCVLSGGDMLKHNLRESRSWPVVNSTVASQGRIR